MSLAFVALLTAIGTPEPPADSIPGWFASPTTDYAVTLDTTVRANGSASARIRATGPQPAGMANLSQWFAADSVRGKRVRVSARLRASSLRGNAQMWVRIDGPSLTRLDNMHDRPVNFDTEWMVVESVLDVPPDAVTVTVGFLLTGAGTLWIDDVAVETVSQSGATTRYADLAARDAAWLTARRALAAERGAHLRNGNFED